jgi:DNA (cytosine-5)-methyltransferase 1
MPLDIRVLLGYSIVMKKQLTYIDLFAGCGGLSVGLHKARWNGLFAVEKNPDAFNTLKTNLIDNRKHFRWPEWLRQSEWDIDNLIKKHAKDLRGLREQVDLVTGGPPCQGFSTAGRRVESDSRNQLVHSYLKFVDLVRPRAVLLENVRGFTMKFSDDSTAYSEIVCKSLVQMGYTDVVGRIIDSADFGLPQSRKRFFAIATLNGNAESVFGSLERDRSKFLKSKNLPMRSSSSAAISDLESTHGCVQSPDTNGFLAGTKGVATTTMQRHLRSGERAKVPDSHRFVNHTERTISTFNKILSESPRNKCISNEFRSRLGIKKRNITPLDPKSPAPTITTIPDDYIHYCEPRVMTARECARLQTFPDWFLFTGPYTTGGPRRRYQTPRYTQIGNAVPPLLAEQIGLALRKSL